MSQTSFAATPTPASPSFTRRYAGYLFWLLWLTNFINYADRYAFVTLADKVKSEFHLNLTEVFLIGSAFLFTYTLGILPLGLLSDRIKRKNVVATGVAAWSVITALTGLVGNFFTLFLVRAGLGVGEGSYYPPGTSLLSSLYPSKERAKVMSRWAMGSLVGIAFGSLVAGLIATAFGTWRAVFFIFGLPGLFLALLMWLTREPPRTAADDSNNPELAVARSGWQGIVRDVRELWQIPTVRVTIAVQALSFFVITSSLNSLAIFLHSTLGASTTTIGTVAGGVFIVGGVGGVYLGSFLADTLIKRYPGARVLVSGWGILLATPTFIAAILSAILPIPLSPTTRIYALFVPFFLLTVILLQLNNGPLTAVVQDVSAPARRAAVIGLSLLLAHLLGDLFTPLLVGVLGDYFTAHAGSASLLQHLGITAGNALGVALMFLAVPALIAGGLVGIWGARFVKKDEEAVRVTA